MTFITTLLKKYDAELLFTDPDSLTYPKDSKFFDETNKNVIGKMKDEFRRVIVNEFVGLKSKIYSIKKKLMAKNQKEMKIMKRIQSKKHKLGTHETGKISLSCFDDKRYVLDDGIYTLAYFHKDSVTSFKEIKKDCDKKDCEKTSC